MMRLGDYEGAQLAFQEALRMNAQYPEALENLGDVLLVKTRRLYQQAEKTSGTKMRLQEKIRALPDFPLPTSAQP
jgi:Flp pilus assembly protein TadD